MMQLLPRSTQTLQRCVPSNNVCPFCDTFLSFLLSNCQRWNDFTTWPSNIIVVFCGNDILFRVENCCSLLFKFSNEGQEQSEQQPSLIQIHFATVLEFENFVVNTLMKHSYITPPQLILGSEMNVLNPISDNTETFFCSKLPSSRTGSMSFLGVKRKLHFMGSATNVLSMR